MPKNYHGEVERDHEKKLKAKEEKETVMTREDITKLFPDATAEQIGALCDINSADIGRAKKDGSKAAEQLAAAQEELKTARSTISELEKNKGDVNALQKQIDEYKAADADRAAKAAAAQKRAEMSQRMDAVLGERKFVHERMHDIVLDDFEKALADKANVGKSDKDVFEAMTKDQTYFAQQNESGGNMGAFGSLNNEAEGMAALRRAFGLPEKP